MLVLGLDPHRLCLRIWSLLSRARLHTRRYVEVRHGHPMLIESLRSTAISTSRWPTALGSRERDTQIARKRPTRAEAQKVVELFATADDVFRTRKLTHLFYSDILYFDPPTFPFSSLVTLSLLRNEGPSNICYCLQSRSSIVKSVCDVNGGLRWHCARLKALVQDICVRRRENIRIDDSCTFCLH